MRKLLASSRLVKTIFAITAAVVVLGSAIGGTVAWIFARSNPVQNTFVANDVIISLLETTQGDGDSNNQFNNYYMAPGEFIDMAPVASVAAQSMPSWLFLKVIESDNFDDFISYTVSDNWTALEGVENVYVRQVERMDVVQAFTILKDNKVQVREEVTNQMLRGLNDENFPTLDFECVAVQSEGIDDVHIAWQVATGEAAPETP